MAFDKSEKPKGLLTIYYIFMQREYFKKDYLYVFGVFAVSIIKVEFQRFIVEILIN